MLLYIITLIFFIFYFNTIFLYTDLRYMKVKNIHLLYYLISLLILFFIKLPNLKIFFYNVILVLILLFLFYYFDLLSAGDSKVILLNIIAFSLFKRDLTFLIYLGILFSLLFIYTFSKIIFRKDKNLIGKFKKRFNIYIFIFYVASSLTMLIIIIKPFEFILNRLRVSFLYNIVILLIKVVLVIYLIRYFNKFFIKIFNKFFKKTIFIILYILFVFCINFLIGFSKEDVSFLIIYFFYVYFLNIFYYELLKEVSYKEKDINELKEGDIIFSDIYYLKKDKVLTTKDINFLKNRCKTEEVKVENIISFTIFIFLTNVILLLYYLFFFNFNLV